VKREFKEESNFPIEVQRLLWILENFFDYEGKKFHGIGFYFLVNPKEKSGIWEQEEFVGQEVLNPKVGKQDLHFKWFNINEITEMEIKPSILSELLQEIPEYPKHVILKA
jgi:hypothetical protein